MKRVSRSGRAAGAPNAPGPRRAAAHPPRAKRATFWRGRWGALAVATLVAVALLGRWWWGSHATREGVRDPAVARALTEQGLALSQQWRLEEALVCFRSARDSWPQDDWLQHDFVANAAWRLAGQNLQHAGLPVEATRSSVERVALVNEALREYDRALRLVQRPSDRASLLSEQGDMFFTWGLQWEADACYEAAARLEPQNRERSNKLAQFRDMLERPELQITTEEAMILAGSRR